MKFLQVVFGIILIVTTSLMLLPSSVSAVTYDLIAPDGVLTRGQDVHFIVKIDSEGTPITSATVGMTYESQYLQFVSATPGDAMTAVTTTQPDGSTLLLTGTNNSGFNSAGVFADVTFKLIAQAAGTTKLCTLFSPGTTPTLAPTVPPQPATPKPTLIVSGTPGNTGFISLIGTALLFTSLISYGVSKKLKFVRPKRSKKN